MCAIPKCWLCAHRTKKCCPKPLEMASSEAAGDDAGMEMELDVVPPPPPPPRPTMRRGGALGFRVSPRIGRDAQVESLPPAEGGPALGRPGTELVWNAAHDESRTSRMLMASRQTVVESRLGRRHGLPKKKSRQSGDLSDDESFEGASWWLNGGTLPLESDEVVLKHLQLVGDADRCEYAMTCGLAAAADATARMRHKAERRAVLKATNAGAASVRGTSSVLATAVFDPARPRDTRFYGPTQGCMGGALNKTRWAPGLRYTHEGAQNIWGVEQHTMDEDEEDEGKQRVLDRRGRGVGRADAKARWRELEARARRIMGTDKTSLAECLDVLREAESLPQSFAEVCAQADQASSLRDALTEVRAEADSVRALSAHARDCVCRGSDIKWRKSYDTMGLAYQGAKFQPRVSDDEEHDHAEGAGAAGPAQQQLILVEPLLPQDRDPLKDAEEILRKLEAHRVRDDDTIAGLTAAIRAGATWNSRAKAICGPASRRSRTADKAAAPPPEHVDPPTPAEFEHMGKVGVATPFADVDLVKKVESLAAWAVSFDESVRVALGARPRTQATYKALFDLRKKLSRGVGRQVADAVRLATRKDLDAVCARAESWLSDSTRVVGDPRIASLATIRRLARLGKDLSFDARVIMKLEALAERGVAWTRDAAVALAAGGDDELDRLHDQAAALSLPRLARRAVGRHRAERKWRKNARALLVATDDTDATADGEDEAKKKPPSIIKLRRHLDALEAIDDSNDQPSHHPLTKAEQLADDSHAPDPDVEPALAAIAVVAAQRALAPASPEETELRGLLDAADEWATRAKAAARADGAESSLTLLSRLTDEGRRLRLDASALIRPLVALQKRVVAWFNATKSARSAIRVLDTTPDVLLHLVDEANADDDDDEDEDNALPSTVEGMMTLDGIVESIATARKIAVAVDEIAQVRMLAARAQAWRGYQRELCGTAAAAAAKEPPPKPPPATRVNAQQTTVKANNNTSSQKSSTTAAALAQLDRAFGTLADFLDVGAERRAIGERRDAVLASITVATEVVVAVGRSAEASAAAFDADPTLPDDATDRIDKLKAALDVTASTAARTRLEASHELNAWCSKVRALVLAPGEEDDRPPPLEADELATRTRERDAIMKADAVDDVRHARVFEKWRARFDELRTRFGVLHSWQKRCHDAAHVKKPNGDELRAVVNDAPRFATLIVERQAAAAPAPALAEGQSEDDLTVVKKRIQWLDEAALALRGGHAKRLQLRAFEALAKRATPIRLGDCDDAKALRAEARKARDWLSSVKKTGIERGEASIAELRKLVASVKSIKVNLADDVEVLVQASRATCVCAAPADGQMLECPGCHTTFHADCLFFACVEAAPAPQPAAPSPAAAAAAGPAAAATSAEAPAPAAPAPKRRRIATAAAAAAAAEAAGDDPEGAASTTKRRGRDDAARKRKGAEKPARRLLDVSKCPRCQLRLSAAQEARTADDLIKMIRGDDGTAVGHAVPGSPAAAALLTASTALGLDSGDTKSKGSDAIFSSGIVALEGAVRALTATAHQNDHARRRLIMALQRLVFAYNVGRLLQRAPRVSSIDALVTQADDAGGAYGEAEYRQRVTSHLLTCRKHARELVARLREVVDATTPRDPRPKVKKERRVDAAKVKVILDQARRIPVRLGKLRRQCEAIIEDGGRRYCICRGPSDGSFMLGCDRCDEWFHGKCVGIKESDDVTFYECDACKKKQQEREAFEKAEQAAAAATAAPLPSPLLPPTQPTTINGNLNGQAALPPPPAPVAASVASPAPSAPESVAPPVVTNSSSQAPASAAPALAAAPAAAGDSSSDSSGNEANQDLVVKHPLPWPPALLLKDELPAPQPHPTKKLRVDTTRDVEPSVLASSMPPIGSVLPSPFMGTNMPPSLSPSAHPLLIDAHRQYMLSFASGGGPASVPPMESRLYETELSRMHMLPPPHMASISPFPRPMPVPSPHDPNSRFVSNMSSILPHIQMTQHLQQLHQQQQQQVQQQPIRQQATPPMRQDVPQQHLLFRQRVLQQQRPPHQRLSPNMQMPAPPQSQPLAVQFQLPRMPQQQGQPSRPASPQLQLVPPPQQQPPPQPVADQQQDAPDTRRPPSPSPPQSEPRPPHPADEQRPLPHAQPAPLRQQQSEPRPSPEQQAPPPPRAPPQVPPAQPQDAHRTQQPDLVATSSEVPVVVVPAGDSSPRLQPPRPKGGGDSASSAPSPLP